MEEGFDLGSLPMKKKKRKKVILIEPGEEEDVTGGSLTGRDGGKYDFYIFGVMSCVLDFIYRLD